MNCIPQSYLRSAQPHTSRYRRQALRYGAQHGPKRREAGSEGAAIFLRRSLTVLREVSHKVSGSSAGYHVPLQVSVFVSVPFFGEPRLPSLVHGGEDRAGHTEGLYPRREPLTVIRSCFQREGRVFEEQTPSDPSRHDHSMARVNA